MDLKQQVLIGLLGIIFTYLGLKARQFERPSEIEQSVSRSFDNYRVFEEAGIKHTIVDVLAEKPGFPERLYKYLPKIKREGFVDVQMSISPYQRGTITLPTVEEIENYDLFPSDVVEIQQANWSDSPTQYANIHLRVHYLNSKSVRNCIHAAMSCIVELLNGYVDEEYHAQFKHTDITDEELAE